MDILNEKEKIDWNRFAAENNGSFLQSWEWGEFQKSLGRNIWRLGGDGWAALVIRYNLPFRKSYLYCPGGPILNEKGKTKNENLQLKTQNFLCEVGKIAKEENAIFLKVEPFWEINGEENGFPLGERFSKYWTDLGFIKSDGGQRILKTLVLDLKKSEEELLAEMAQKTRYNIKIARRNGVKIRISVNPKEDFEEFWRLLQQTAKRNKIRTHPKSYYLRQLLVSGGDEISGLKEGANRLEAKFFLAECDQKVIAANIVHFFGKTAIYLHGASDYEKRGLMSPYLLQWEQIKEAKGRSCEIYDFWGIDAKAWPGVTRFKKGFGGKEISYIGAWDYVFDKKRYWIYRLTKKIF